MAHEGAAHDDTDSARGVQAGSLLVQPRAEPLRRFYVLPWQRVDRRARGRAERDGRRARASSRRATTSTWSRPSARGRSPPAGRWRRRTGSWIAGEFLDAVRERRPVDAVYFSLHGAMAAEGEGDPEGYLLAETRKILGERIPIVISLDLHGILTDRMLEHTDALTVYHTYPHEDMFETGARAARLLLRILDEGVRPATAVVKIPALVRGKELITETGSSAASSAAARRSKRARAASPPACSSATPSPMCPTCARTASSSPTTRNGRRARRGGWPRTSGRCASALHEDLTPLDEAVRIAKETTGHRRDDGRGGRDEFRRVRGQQRHPARLAGGRLPGRALMPIIDPRAAAAAFAAGVGNPVRTAVGGAFDPARFPPIDDGGARASARRGALHRRVQRRWRRIPGRRRSSRRATTRLSSAAARSACTTARSISRTGRTRRQFDLRRRQVAPLQAAYVRRTGARG